MLSVLVKELMKRGSGGSSQIHVFTVDNIAGEGEWSNIKSAKSCVEYLERQYEGRLDIIHHMVVVDTSREIEKGIEEVIKGIISNIETYDPGMVRSGIMYTYLMKYISENTDVKVLLSGEGLEELCGHREFNGLDDARMQEKSVKLIKYLSKFEMLVGDKISGAFGLECRYPYLDGRLISHKYL